MEEFSEKQKDVESVCNPIITKLYQGAGGMPGGEFPFISCFIEHCGSVSDPGCSSRILSNKRGVKKIVNYLIFAMLKKKIYYKNCH